MLNVPLNVTNTLCSIYYLWILAYSKYEMGVFYLLVWFMLNLDMILPYMDNNNQSAYLFILFYGQLNILDVYKMKKFL